jgi:rhodanese-related sulfurtransferase
LTAVYSSQTVRKALDHAATASMLAATVFAAVACHGRASRPHPITVGQLAALLKSADPPRLYDTNGDRTRREYGVIPGATLLPSSHDYALDLLPAQKTVPVIFYCASTWCGAAESAASRAVQAGYAQVSVLPDGIKGWKEAGLPVQKVN